MANAQTIQKFYTVAAQRDFARKFQFRLNSFGNINFGTEHFTYLETASLPGRQISNIPVPYMGLQFNVPGTASYPGSASYKVTFRCDQNYDLRAALEGALFNTFDEVTSTGDYSLPAAASPAGLGGNTLTMELLDKQLNPVRYYTLYGVWLQSIDDEAYDIKDNGSVVMINATISYQFWRAGAASPVPPNALVQTKVPSWFGKGI